MFLNLLLTSFWVAIRIVSEVGFIDHDMDKDMPWSFSYDYQDAPLYKNDTKILPTILRAFAWRDEVSGRPSYMNGVVTWRSYAQLNFEH